MWQASGCPWRSDGWNSCWEKGKSCYVSWMDKSEKVEKMFQKILERKDSFSINVIGCLRQPAIRPECVSNVWFLLTNFSILCFERFFCSQRNCFPPSKHSSILGADTAEKFLKILAIFGNFNQAVKPNWFLKNEPQIKFHPTGIIGDWKCFYPQHNIWNNFKWFRCNDYKKHNTDTIGGHYVN